MQKIKLASDTIENSDYKVLINFLKKKKISKPVKGY